MALWFFELLSEVYDLLYDYGQGGLAFGDVEKGETKKRHVEKRRATSGGKGIGAIRRYTSDARISFSK